jgi:hypothetical protein
MVARANRRNATAARSIANDASAAAVDDLDTPATVDAFVVSSSSADDCEHFDDFLLSLGSSPLGSPDTNAIVGETPNDVDVNAANDCDDTSVNDKEEDVDESEFLPNAAVNDDTIMHVDAPSNDANEEGEDTNMEEDTSLDAQDDTSAAVNNEKAQSLGGDSTTACPSMSSNADGDATDEEEEEGVGGMWELTKIYTVKELKKSKPIMCSTEDCNHIACSRWDSIEGGTPWNSCLDCQEA